MKREPEVVLKQAEVTPNEVMECLDAIFEILFEETCKVFDFAEGSKPADQKRTSK